MHLFSEYFMQSKYWLKRNVLLCLCFLLGLTASGCAYSNVVMPLDTNTSKTKLGTKIGRSSAKSVLYLFAWGDAGVAKAAENGGLTTVNHLDRESFVVLFGLYTEVTTIAYGD